MKRLFFALDLPASIRDELESLQESIEEHLRGGVRVRWTPRENLHLTLKFLGTLEDGLVLRLREIGDELVDDVEPVEMTVRDVGAFPSPAHPRILWAGVDRQSQELLAKLHGRLEERLRPIDVEPDEHDFTAHVTIGRVKSSRGPALTDWRAELPTGPYGEMQLEELVLYESELDDSGAEYTVLHRSPFGGG
ncbi:MAG: RNA 2',3'-cyclic phosphodiesterase [Bradymonadaceae bacterium]